MLINEFKETISEEEIINTVNRIRALPENKIDELWHLCNFIISGHEKDNLKALRAYDLEKIKTNPEGARQQVVCLFRETKKADLEKNLKTVEKQ